VVVVTNFEQLVADFLASSRLSATASDFRGLLKRNALRGLIASASVSSRDRRRAFRSAHYDNGGEAYPARHECHAAKPAKSRSTRSNKAPDKSVAPAIHHIAKSPLGESTERGRKMVGRKAPKIKFRLLLL
jgi:hypothetical protein